MDIRCHDIVQDFAGVLETPMFHCMYVLLFACKLSVLGSGICYAAASVVVAMSAENLFALAFSSITYLCNFTRQQLPS